MSIVHLEFFENDFQNGLPSEARIGASVFFRIPPVETVDGNGSNLIPRFPINSQVSTQARLIVGTNGEGISILRPQPVQPETIGRATGPIRHPKPSVGLFLSLRVADCSVKNGLMVFVVGLGVR